MWWYTNLFLFSLVSLKLIDTKNNNLVDIVWENQKPSIRYCWPIRFIFEKETIGSTKHDVGKIEREINVIKIFEVSNLLSVNFYLTMIDYKVISYSLQVLILSIIYYMYRNLNNIWIQYTSVIRYTKYIIQNAYKKLIIY